MSGLPAPRLDTLMPGPPPLRLGHAASVHVLLDEIAVWRSAARSAVALGERDVQLLHERRLRATAAMDVSRIGLDTAANDHQRHVDERDNLASAIDDLRTRHTTLAQSLNALRRVAATQVEVIERELERGKGVLGYAPSSDRQTALKRALLDARAALILHDDAMASDGLAELLEQLTRRLSHLDEALATSESTVHALDGAHDVIIVDTTHLDTATHTAQMLLDAVRYRRSRADAAAGIGEHSAAEAFADGNLRMAGDLT
jgi:hypothetical protein